MPRHTANRSGLLLLLWSLSAVVVSAQTPAAADLEGTWTVDLRPLPDAEPYLQEMVLRLDADGALAGTFYGTPLRDGRLNLDWGNVRFAFVTEDGAGAYYTSGVLRDGRIEGTTHSLARGFLSVWSATRSGSEPSRGPAEPNPAAPPETNQFAFLIGERGCTIRRMQADGTYGEGETARWNGRLILDGWAIEDEWISPLPDGTVSRGINIRSFNPRTRKWDNRWLATGSLQWVYFEAEQVGDTMVMIGGEGEDANGTFVDRNVFSEIRSDGFSWRKDRSWDGGENWLEGVARIECQG